LVEKDSRESKREKRRFLREKEIIKERDSREKDSSGTNSTETYTSDILERGILQRV
jgi:hypothetical protein